MFNFLRKRERMTVEFTEGSRGRWRWQGRDKSGRVRFLSPVNGFATLEDAETDWYHIHKRSYSVKLFK